MAQEPQAARVTATYEHGTLRPDRPLHLREGEHVDLILVRRPDPARWDFGRLAVVSEEEVGMSEAGLGAWADDLDRIDRS